MDTYDEDNGDGDGDGVMIMDPLADTNDHHHHTIIIIIIRKNYRICLKIDDNYFIE